MLSVLGGRLFCKSVIAPRLLPASFYNDAYNVGEPFHPIPGKTPKLVSAEEAVAAVKSNDSLFIHGAAATPIVLLEALCRRAKADLLRGIKVYHIHTEGTDCFTRPEMDGIIRSTSLFTGANCRKAIEEGRADFMPIFLGDIPLLFRRNIIHLDAALITVSPPDQHGFCSLGTSVDAARSAVQNAKMIIAIANKKLPRTFGDGIIHQSHIDFMVETDTPLPTGHHKSPSEEERRIGVLIAENLVANGATLQMGIGSIPDSVLIQLTTHKDLGVHSEMFSDGIVDLIQNGIITNAKKIIQPGKTVGSFCVGTTKLYDFINNNPSVLMCDVAFTNSSEIISMNPRATAINACIEVDITGQVVSDSIGTRIYSGVGGQVDFIRGAALGKDGLGVPILAMQSCTKKGESKIVPVVKQGAGVVTSRSHAHYIVTEWGIAHLFGKNIRQRAHALIQIAHPDHRAALEKAAYERLKVMPSP